MADPAIKAASAIIDQGKAAPVVVKSFFDEDTFTATHVVSDPATAKAAIIDSVLDYDPASGRTTTKSADAVIAYVKNANLDIEWILETHAHADHISAAPYLIERLGGTLAIGEHITQVQGVFSKVFNLGDGFNCDGSQFGKLFADGETFMLGSVEAVALHVPGHTPADMAFVVGDAAFIGDTLFMPDYGTARADFPGGDARQLFRSIRRLLSLPGEARLFLCHDYKAPKRDTFVWETTIAAQRQDNVHVHDGIGEDEFVRMREARDATLDMPRLILPSIQVNIRGGHFPEPEANGTRYLKIPVDAL
ncbi:MBL fold metallo-hydrolase [Sphingorhabdus sp.]|jgi:glyoxylase-like metal-dependent hydrolase (beta-lactamase superfamily II)|uniref:MBL fold metallo-hydrolase n=2 Tax=Sphingorhabdus sp. TaxID=1902408 RepID=UPI003BB0503E|nr:MBL fold metallo-hydrolase [Sphingomonadales bacterium]MBL0022639.1 MBL fold metallo-hydrolase [Sphingomonadales bacterium]